MSREWPPGWEDPEDAELDAEELDGEDDVRLAEVAAFLATVPAPVLPGAIESRIVAALAAESAARAAESPARAPEPDAPRILRPRPAPARVRRRDRARPAMFNRIRPAMVAGPLVACLLFAGLGYAISRTSSSSSSSSAPYAAPAASSAAASGPGAPANGSAGSGQRSEAGSAASTGNFAVTKSGTDYREATLAVQVREVIAAAKRASSPAVPSPASSSSSAAASSTSSAAVSSASASGPQYASLAPNSLRGCVAHFTGGAPPRLIDRARYQGTPVYVIASASRVWVVGLDCTAGRPDLIASASLGS